MEELEIMIHINSIAGKKEGKNVRNWRIFY